MTDIEKRIKLAEAMGWKHCQMRENLQRYCWQNPISKLWVEESELPDPFTDANDCNALIKHLNGLGIAIELNLDENGYVVVQGYKAPDPFFSYEGDNWMQGVCELALKVIENDRLLKAAQEPCPLA